MVYRPASAASDGVGGGLGRRREEPAGRKCRQGDVVARVPAAGTPMTLECTWYARPWITTLTSHANRH